MQVVAADDSQVALRIESLRVGRFNGRGHDYIFGGFVMNQSEAASKERRKIRFGPYIDRCDFITLVNRNINGLDWENPASLAQWKSLPSNSPAITGTSLHVHWDQPDKAESDTSGGLI